MPTRSPESQPVTYKNYSYKYMKNIFFHDTIDFFNETAAGRGNRRSRRPGAVARRDKNIDRLPAIQYFYQYFFCEKCRI